LKKRLLILSNHFVTTNFRKEFIERLVIDGHEVFISSPESSENKIFNNNYFRHLGCSITDTHFERRGLNPIEDLKLIFHYIKIIKKINPHLVFSYTIKPTIYGLIASIFTHHKQITTITGTGSTFLSKSILSFIVKFLYRISLERSHKIYFQNEENKKFFIENKLIKRNSHVLPGSGVNLDEFKLETMPDDGKTNFIFIGRIKSLKGVDQYLEAAERIKEDHKSVNFYIAGFIEEEKFKSIIENYHSKGIINYLGFQTDIKSWIRQCHCTILPSLGGEGVPNTLLESSAMGRVCIASNIPGSKEVVENEKTGFLFTPGNTDELLEKIRNFIQMDYSEKVNMGIAAREKMEKEFDRQIVVEAYMRDVDNA